MRNIGIIRDGQSDFSVLKKLIQIIFKKEKDEILNDNNFYEFSSLSLHDIISELYRKNLVSCNFLLNFTQYDKYEKIIINKLYSAYSQMNRQFENITNKDIIILNSDAEKILNNSENYFSDWAFCLSDFLKFIIYKFYHKMVKNGYSYKNLPLIYPIIFFPSTEILIASIKLSTQNYRKFEAKALKLKLYGTVNLKEVTKDNGLFFEILNKFIIEDNLELIYKRTPELREFIHFISL